MQIDYGQMVDQVENNAIVLNPEDFQRHCYAVGATGTGKTTLMLNAWKNLEMANKSGLFENAMFYLDPKGDEAMKFIKVCEKENVKSGKIHYLDPIITGFGINPLELPPHDPEKRDEVVSRYIDYFLSILKQWAMQTQVYVQMERIFRLLLQYLYQNSDSPTMIDIHDLIIKLQEKNENIINSIYEKLGTPSREIDKALRSVSSLDGGAFTPLLNRIEQFATDPILKKLFCVKKSTVNFSELIQPGHITVVRMSELNLAEHVRTLALQAFVIKLWFAIQERANEVLQENRKQVILFLDEFHKLGDIQLLHPMISESRSMKLGLFLAHQTIGQINKELFEEIVGNCQIQFSGRISGTIAGIVAKAWDPTYKSQIEGILATQANFRWTIRTNAPQGEQPPPIQFWLAYPPEPNMTNEEFEEFVKTQKDIFGNTETSTGLIEEALQKEEQWKSYCDVLVLNKFDWKIILSLRDGPKGVSAINLDLPEINRDIISSEIIPSMIYNKIIEITTLPGQKENSRNKKYKLTETAVQKYLNFDFSAIGKHPKDEQSEKAKLNAKNLNKVAMQAIKYYHKQKMFVAVASQNVKAGEDRTDLIAYDYENNIPISVEVESEAEANSHPAQVKHNMIKWKKLGFSKCHVWSSNARITKEPYQTLDEDIKKNVKIFLVKFKS